MVEFCGEAIRDLSMEGVRPKYGDRDSAKAACRAGRNYLFNYVRGRSYAPKGKDFDGCHSALEDPETDDGATFDTVVTPQAEELPAGDLGHQLRGQVISVTDNIPDPASFSDPVERASAEKKRWPIWG